MKRFGPLQSLREVLTVGDPTRSHLVFTRDEIRHQFEDDVKASYDWAEVSGIQLDLPTTMFRFPGLVSGVILSGVALFVQDDPHISPKDGAVTIASRDEIRTHPLSCHHLGGYWRRSVDVTQRLVEQLVADSAARSLLDRPDALIESASGAGRRRA